MSDFLCVGYEGMSDAIRDHKGERVFTPEQIRQRFGEEMKELKVTFPFKIKKGYVENRCAWFSQLQGYMKAKGFGIEKNE